MWWIVLAVVVFVAMFATIFWLFADPGLNKPGNQTRDAAHDFTGSLR